jgi:prepilin-type processing-associated H-X9-DG protein
MPIAYTCPNCGKQYSVADQYAGQTGPCAACGKPITVPMTGAGYAPVPAPSGGGAAGAVITVLAILAVMFLVCGGIAVALLLPAVQAARTAARRSQSSNNLMQIALALQNYHDTYNAFPPAVVTDANGNPLYSGRVLLLPYLEQYHIYDQWDKSQAWDSPANKALSDTKIMTFCDPGSTSGMQNRTDYLFATGTGTIFEGGQPMSMSDATDGTSNTLFAVEVKDSGIQWAEPKDLDLSQPTALPQGHYPGGNNAAYLDGHVEFMRQLSPGDVRARATRGGGEPINY